VTSTVLTPSFSCHVTPVPVPFPADLVDAAAADNPNIFVTSPHMGIGAHGQHPHASFPTPLSSAPSLAGSLHSLSPASSPTTADFGAHLPQLHHHSHAHAHAQTLSRQASFSQQTQSPGPGAYDDGGFGGAASKRQRTQAPAGKRARSDSAPLGYGFGQPWAATRPRSGSGLARREDMVSIAGGAGSLGRSAGHGHLAQIPALPALPKPSP
jgi:hypothetical protein